MAVDGDVDIFNLALGACGARNNLSATTEKDRGAELCRLYYPLVRDQILASAYWPSCRAVSRLAVIVERDTSVAWEAGDPDPGYTLTYGLPADFLYPRYMTDYSRFALGSHEVHGKVLYSSVEDAMLVYTKRTAVPMLWEPHLRMAIAYGLAAHIAKPLTGKRATAGDLIQQANSLILAARASGDNEGSERFDILPDWITARGYSNPGDEKYYYPYGAHLSVI